MLRPIAIATAISGTLDMLFAMILTVFFGREIGNMLRYLGSGPFPQATEMGAGGAMLGLLVHFALMAIMASVYVLAARRIPALVERPIQWGVLYGLATYAVMNWLVVPMRFGTPLPPSPLSMATQLFAHIVLVGVPIALIAAAIPEAAARVTDAGYSGTPLGKKLGYCEGMRVFVDGMPEPIRHGIEKSIDARPDWQLVPGPGLEAAHIFVTARAALEAKIQTLLPLLKPSGAIWVSWPKKAAKVPTDITEDTIREVVLPMGLVDVKVCAVDATWSGLKLMKRKVQ